MAGTIVLGIAKWIFQVKAKKKLNNEEFMAHIRAHQIRRKNVGEAALSFEEALAKAEKELDQEDQ